MPWTPSAAKTHLGRGTVCVSRIWIMDGHNMIFAIPPLQRLQVSDRREEARRGLADRLEQFALVRGEKVLLVFDGNALPSNPDAARGPLFEIVYAPRGACGLQPASG